MGLITTIDELKQFIEANRGIDITTIQPSLDSAELRYLVPALGKNQYNALIAAYQVANKDVTQIADDSLKTLALSAQKVVSNLAMMILTDRIKVTISETGIRRNETDDAKSAFQYQEIDLKESYADAGFDSLEDMLGMMEDDPAHYAAWRASDAFTEQKRFIISSATQFSQFYQIYRSRLSYMSVRNIMHRVENFMLKKVIGPELFAAIKNGLKNGNLSDDYQALIDEYIGFGIAYYTIAAGLIEDAVEVNEKGVTVKYTAPDNHRPSREPAPTDKVKLMVDQLNTVGGQYLQELNNELTANPGKYPDYVAPSSSATPFLTINNSQTNSFFAIG